MKLNDLIQRVRAHPGIADSAVGKTSDDNFAFVVAQLVPSVLNQLSESTGQIIDKRNYVMSDPLSAIAPLDDEGKADLTDLIAEEGILLERLRFGEIKHPDSPYPMVPLANSAEGLLPGNWDRLFLHYWVVGSVLQTKSKNNNQTPLTGDISFAVPCVGGLDTLNPQLVDELVSLLVIRLRGATAPQAVAK